MYKKVLLCTPYFPTYHGWPSYPHLGIGYLSSVLSKNGVENEVLDMRLGYTEKDFVDKVNQFKPDLVGVTMMTRRHDLAYKLVSLAKSLGRKIIVGGPHVSTFRKQVLNETKADFGVTYEGEYTLLELCQGKDPSEINGLIYKKNDRIIENSDRIFIKDLDKVSFPTYKKFELEKYARKKMPIVTSRGCPYQCIYCPIKATMGREYRCRSPENVVEELKYWHNRGYREFDFQDDNFTLKKDRAYKICDLIEQNDLKDLQIMCGNGVRADLVDRDLLKRMREVGFNNITIGVEAGNNKVLKRIKKGEDIETIENTIRTACDLGYEVVLAFMVGHPGETPEDVEDSIRLALKYPVALANFFNIVPFPRSELYDWIKENNYFVRKPEEYLNADVHYDNDPVFETPEFSLEERRKALIRTKKIVRLTKRKSMERKLQKYIFGKFIASLVYSNFIYNSLLWSLQHSKIFKRILLFILRKLKLEFHL